MAAVEKQFDGYVTSDPEILGGEPVLVGTRRRLMLECNADGATPGPLVGVGVLVASTLGLAPDQRRIPDMRLHHPLLVVTLVLAVLLSVVSTMAQQPLLEKKPEVPYVPTHEKVVAEMLKVAKVGKNDILYDLGSGDGRIVITAAKEFGARGVGVDIDPALIREARENALKAGVADKVKFLQQDLFETDIREATVVTLYLLPEVNRRLRPKLLSDLKPGTRVVSHNHDMGDWTPLKTLNVRVPQENTILKTLNAPLLQEHTIYYWVVPPPHQPLSPVTGR